MDQRFVPDVIVAPDPYTGDEVRRLMRWGWGMTRVLTIASDAHLLRDISYDLVVVDFESCDPSLLMAALGGDHVSLDYRRSGIVRPTRDERRTALGFRTYRPRARAS